MVNLLKKKKKFFKNTISQMTTNSINQLKVFFLIKDFIYNEYIKNKKIQKEL
jgi:hypothetical protein